MSGFAFRVADGAVHAVAVDDAPGATGDLVWVHLAANDREAHRWLCERAGLGDHIADTLTASETRPRCDPAPGDGVFINLRGLSDEARELSDPLASVRIYAREGRVVSVSRKRLNGVAVVCDAIAGGGIDDPGDLIAAIATAITNELDPAVADLGDSLDDCEERLEADNAFALRRRVNHVRIEAIGYRRFLYPQRSALEKLATIEVPWLAEDDRLHLGAAADRAARMAEELESIRERAALIHETLTDLRAEQIDQRSLIIAVVAMVFLPLTFLTGLLGMNVSGIPFAHRSWAFAGVVLVCAVLALAITAYFARRHWFRR
ncbi:CorA family divalent cation transporter [Stakelama saccharophila]|uniref:CorA family divalent cation transporter n=1 Tax=Stakelama saccharophila TaxID=3075605 RepID=A0ABZ0B9H9_9SPHN|nr:CorA family divalent cation transporter [Stakelama sp. W311]WNO53710.1 CorA family divalent cation transporter [Stakelama sp. W311]